MNKSTNKPTPVQEVLTAVKVISRFEQFQDPAGKNVIRLLYEVVSRFPEEIDADISPSNKEVGLGNALESLPLLWASLAKLRGLLSCRTITIEQGVGFAPAIKGVFSLNALDICLYVNDPKHPLLGVEG